MRPSECTECRWEFAFQLVPSCWEVGVSVSMRSVRNVVSLTNVNRSWIAAAVRRMIAQRFHAYFRTFVHHYGVEITTHSLHPQPLKFVHTSIGTIFALQLSFEWSIWLILGSLRTHNIPFLIDVVPTMRVATCA